MTLLSPSKAQWSPTVLKRRYSQHYRAKIFTVGFCANVINVVVSGDTWVSCLGSYSMLKLRFTTGLHNWSELKLNVVLWLTMCKMLHILLKHYLYCTFLPNPHPNPLKQKHIIKTGLKQEVLIVFWYGFVKLRALFEGENCGSDD